MPRVKLPEDVLERLEDAVDLILIEAALADPTNAEPIPWEQVKQELDLD